MGDAVTCAVAGQKTPDGYYALDRMLRSVARRGGQIACCGTCLDTRGLTKEHLIDEAPRSTIDELAAWTIEADQVLTSDPTTAPLWRSVQALSNRDESSAARCGCLAAADRRSSCV